MRTFGLFIFALLLAISARAQNDPPKPVQWTYQATKTGESEYLVRFIATIEKGWHIYDLNLQSEGPIPTSFSFADSAKYDFLGKVAPQAKPIVEKDKAYDMVVSFYEKKIEFCQKVRCKEAPTALKGQLEFMACNNKMCLPPEQVNFEVPLAAK